jgi:hypothetical protein
MVMAIASSGGVAVGGAQAPATSATPPEPTAGAGPWVLPKPPGAALALTMADFTAAAKQLGVEVAAIRAVAGVESGGSTGFDAKKRPTLRYENHIFRQLTGHKYDAKYPDLSTTYGSAEYRATHQFGGTKYEDEQWALLERAFALSPNAAVEACSWGMFQIMGMNAKAAGWTSLEQFVLDMFWSASQHLRAFLGFCKANGLVTDLKKHAWASFAASYNGPSYKDNDYDGKLASYYATYSK